MPTPPPVPAPAARLAAWLESLPATQLGELARRYAAASASAGATMLKADGRVVPIPPLLTPEILDANRIAQVERNAHAITLGLSLLTRWLMSAGGTALRERLFCAFGDFEREALLGTWREAERLATVRVDYLIDGEGTPRALEVNSTIPAMQGYSDAVAGAFLDEVGRERGVPPGLPARLLDDNGRNADQLLASLLAHDQLLDQLLGEPGPRAPRPRRIAIVAREGDSQIGELRYLAARFAALGHPTFIATPEQAQLVGGSLEIGGQRPDLVYRHVFARRLDPGAAFARACLEPRRHRILNPIASHLEVKGMLGLLSRAADGDPGEDELAQAVGLPDEVRREVVSSVPWTRLLLGGPARGPGGERMDDLVEEVAAEPRRFVLKRSWDYGGRSVFLGADHDDAARARAGEVLGQGGDAGWDALVRAAAADPRDAWVVQEFVSARARRHLVVGEAGPEWKALYVDLSVYTNLGVAERPQGGVTRASLRRIVNLQGGGGLAPLIRAEIIDRLLAGG